MFSIGIFSKINKVTTKALRYYDEIGLLSPGYIDDKTKYRYYTTEQLPKLHQIITLKQMGLSLNEIREIIDSSEKVEEILMFKEKEIIAIIESEQHKLLKLRSYLKGLKGEDDMKNIIVKSLPKVKVASMRRIVKNYDEFFNLCPNVMAKEMERLGCVCEAPSYFFSICHDDEYKKEDIDVEICESIVELKENSDILKFKVIDEVEKAVCILHKGSYSSLCETYSYALQWINENKYKVVGDFRESYIDGIWNKESEEEWLTEIQIPVEVDL